MKTVSVIIPVHNRHELFEKCVSSVLSQKIRNCGVEIIIVDEASQPPIKNSIPNKKPKFIKRIKVIRNQRALGPSLARAKGLKIATGEYICFLDSDDIWHPDFLQTSKRNLDPELPQISTTFINPFFIEGVSVSNKITYYLISQLRWLAFSLLRILNAGKLPHEYLYLLRFSAMMFTRKAIGTSSFVMSYRTAEDWKFIWDSIKRTNPEIKIIPQHLVKATYSPKSESVRRSHYWGYYYKLYDEVTPELRNKFGMKLFRKYIDFNVWKNHSEKEIHYKPKND